MMARGSSRFVPDEVDVDMDVDEYDSDGPVAVSFDLHENAAIDIATISMVRPSFIYNKFT